MAAASKDLSGGTRLKSGRTSLSRIINKMYYTSAMKRKAIQIVATNEPGGSGDIIYALCDDGTLWAIHFRDVFGDWIPVPAVPQDAQDHLFSE